MDRSPRAAQNETTLREVFDGHARFVWRTLRHLGIREEDLPDLCQEVFVVVHRKLSDFEGRSALSTWLYGICLRVARDHRRRAHVRREVPVSELPVEHTSTSQDATLERNESRALLARLLSSLDEAKLEVFVLYEIEGLGMKEVADAVGCPLQTAYSRLHAARALLSEKARTLDPGARDE